MVVLYNICKSVDLFALIFLFLTPLDNNNDSDFHIYIETFLDFGFVHLKTWIFGIKKVVKLLFCCSEIFYGFFGAMYNPII